MHKKIINHVTVRSILQKKYLQESSEKSRADLTAVVAG